MRTCRICKIKKPIQSFRTRQQYGKRYYYYECKTCYNERIRKDLTLKVKRTLSKKQDRKENPEKYRGYELKKRHRITLDTYSKKLEEQGGVCAICSEKNSNNRNLTVDHSHLCCPGETSCGKCLRGLLCHSCNSGIGGLRDDINILYKAIEYLNKVKPGIWQWKNKSSLTI